MFGKRKPLSKRLRFEIFKRDGFRCAYCGATPVQRELHVDHVDPVASGGGYEPTNLVTACADCNLGKSSVPLETRRFEVSADMAEGAKDHAEQLRLYLAQQKEVAEARREIVEMVAEEWERKIGPMTQLMHDRLGGIVREWSADDITRAIDITALKVGSAGQEFRGYWAERQAKYFHGILRRWREEKGGSHGKD